MIPQDDTAQLRARIDQLEERGAARIRELNAAHDDLRRAHARADDLERDMVAIQTKVANFHDAILRALEEFHGT